MEGKREDICTGYCAMGILKTWKKDVFERLSGVKRCGCAGSTAAMNSESAQAQRAAVLAAAAAALSPREFEGITKEAERIWALHKRTRIPPPGKPRRHSMTAGKAFEIFVRYTEMGLTVHQQQARSRIQRAHRLSQPRNIQALVAARLKDLDDLLFHGDLDKRVPVLWKDVGPDIWGQTCGGPGDKSNIRIELAESLIPFAVGRPDLVWGTLIHELLHAYALVMSPENEMCLCGHRVAHGPGFAAAARAAVKMLEIEAMTFESVVSYRRGLCHSDCEDGRLQAFRGSKEVEGECTLSEELQGMALT